MKLGRRPALRVFSVAVLALSVASCLDSTPTSSDGAVAPPAATTAVTPQAGDFVPGRILVGMQPGASAAALAAANGLTVERPLGGIVWALRVPPSSEVQVAHALARNPNVQFAEPDFIRTSGTLMCAFCTLAGGHLMGYRWDLQNDGAIVNASGTVLATGGVAGADLEWTPAYQELGNDFPGSVIVAILDTGIRSDHEEFTGRILPGYNFVADNANPADDDGHGTHVTGIIGARAGNGRGGAGIAWGPDIRFLPVKICGPTAQGTTCADSNIYQGINYAVAQGAKVLNLSVGGLFMSSTVRTALQNARAQNRLPVCSAGNNALSIISYPAAWPECVAVTATDWVDGLASYSNYGTGVDISAPGGDNENASGYSYIASSYHTGPGNYALMAGTSMAAPQVSGLAALLFSQGMTDDDAVLELIKSSAEDKGTAGYDTRFGYGRINVTRALEMLDGGTPPPPPPPGNQAPVADFSHTCSALTCSFTDTSTDSDGTVTGWSWSFGDGNSSTQRNPTHTYASEANFTVTLTATDDDGATATRSKSVSTVPNPALITADFTVSCTNLTCQFTNLSTHRNGVNLLANWDMGDNSGQKLAWSPTHTYAAPGTYVVIMVVLAEDFSGWASKRDTITVSNAPPPPTGPTAAYSYSCTYLACTFMDQSTAGSSAISSRVWSFGDGSATETGTSVTHTFGAGGTFAVTLTVTDANGLSDPETKQVTVAPPTPPTANFTYSCTFLACTFTDASTAGSAAITSRSWSFGDAATATGSSVTHTFASANSYSVTLTVGDGNGLSDGETKTVTVEAVPVISLAARGYKVKGRHMVELTWSGATSQQIVIERNGLKLITVANTAPPGSNVYVHAMTTQGSASYAYRVCQADASGNSTGICSQTVPVVF